MTLERKDIVQDISTTAGTAAFTPAGTPPTGFQPISVHTVGATFRYKAVAGAQWEIGTGTWNGTTVARSVRKSSNGDALVNFTTAPTILEVVDATDVSAFLTAADGVDINGLTQITPTTSHVLPIIDPATGLWYKTTVAAILALTSGGAVSAAVAPGQVTGLAAGAATDTTQVLTFTAPSTGTAPFTYKVERSPAGANTWTTAAAAASGSPYTVTSLTASTSYDYRVSATNSAGTGPVSATLTTSTAAAPVVAPGQVTGLTAGTTTSTTQDLSWSAVSGATSYKVEKSPAGANTWTTAATPTGTSTTVTGLTASTNYDYRVSAVNTAGTGTPSITVTKSTIAAPVQTITVATPAAQTVGTPFNVTGAYTNGTPAALDYRLSDDTAGVWTQVTTATIGSGAFSFSVTPSTTSAGRTISVRDRTTLVSGTSGSYVVNAAAATGAPNYILTPDTNGFPTAPAAMTQSGNDKFAGQTINIYVKTADGTSSPAAGTLKFVWGKSPTVPPMAYADATVAAGSANGNIDTHGNAVAVPSRLGNWPTSNPQLFGLYSSGSSFYAWGTPGNWYLWVLTSDGFKKAYDNNTGTPIAWVLT